MAKNEINETTELSKSKAKRAERQKELAKEKKQKIISKIISIVIAVAIIGVFVGAIGYNIYKSASITKSSSDFSAKLTEDGKISGVNVTSAVTVPDYKNLTIAKADVSATDEEIESDIQSLLESHKELVSDDTVTIADGDTVNIDYVGYIDGVEFEGGNSNGEGSDLTIGSNSFIDTFEEQLIGHKPGDEVTVEVTFPEDYSSEDLAGKPATFEVSIHGVYVTPEFTDEFVQEYCSKIANTAADYRASIEKNYYDERLENYLEDYLSENSVVNSYPKSYVKTVKSHIKYNDETTLSYYGSMFAQYGYGGYENVWDLRDGIDSEKAYEKELITRAQDSVKLSLAYQAIFENEELTLDMDSYLAKLANENGQNSLDEIKASYGMGYIAQTGIRDVVIKYLMDTVNVQ